MSYPFGKKLKRSGKQCPQQNDLLISRAAFAPYRFEIPVVKKVTERKKAINPATGKPWQVWFVNNTSSSSGTFESPFPTLVQAQNASIPNDMIYIFPGNGTTTGMNAGITLKNGQQLFGSSIAHTIGTAQGRVTIPAYSVSPPTLTSSGSVVVLANSNQVSGINMTLGSIGINGASGINGALIDRNWISGPLDYGMLLIGSGSFTVSNNQVQGTGDVGIVCSYVNGGVSKTNISNNRISGFSQCVNIETTPPGASAGIVDLTIADNFFTSFNNSGIFLSAEMSNSSYIIVRNSVINTVGLANSQGISIDMDNGIASSFIIENNNVMTSSTNAPVQGIVIASNGSFTGSNVVGLNNNQIQTGIGSGSNGVLISNNVANFTMCMGIAGNQVSLQAASGTNGMTIKTTTPTSVINIDEFAGNEAPQISISGNVNFVAPGACTP